jgi:hypothetical protein
MSPRPTVPAVGIVEEKHYTPTQLGGLWGFSPTKIRQLLKDEQGVLRLQGLGPSAGKRTYTTYSIPESVATRIHQRLSQQPLQTVLPRRHPRRVVLLRDRHRRVAKQV